MVAWRAADRYWPALAWASVALVAVVVGPFAHRHYWVQAVPPLAVLAGIGAASLRGRTAVAAVAVVVAVPLGVQGFLATQNPARRTALVIHDHRLLAAADVSAWVRAHSAPTDQVYAFVASADLYLLTGRATGYPYLWSANLQEVPGAKTQLARWLTSPDGPRYVVVYQQPMAVDPTGALTRALAGQYSTVATVHGYAVL